MEDMSIYELKGGEKVDRGWLERCNPPAAVYGPLQQVAHPLAT